MFFALRKVLVLFCLFLLAPVVLADFSKQKPIPSDSLETISIRRTPLTPISNAPSGSSSVFGVGVNGFNLIARFKLLRFEREHGVPLGFEEEFKVLKRKGFAGILSIGQVFLFEKKVLGNTTMSWQGKPVDNSFSVKSENPCYPKVFCD